MAAAEAIVTEYKGSVGLGVYVSVVVLQNPRGEESGGIDEREDD
jgi:hypothetical protein